MAVERWYAVMVVICKMDCCTIMQKDDWPVSTCRSKGNTMIKDISSYIDCRRAVFKYSYLTLAKVEDVANHCR